MAQKAIQQVEIGFKANYIRQVTEELIRKFAEVSGDVNPLHLDAEYAKKTFFRERIAHGILSVGFISAAMNKLPGVVVYLSQTAKFLRPVKIGDSVEAIAEVVEKIEEKSELRLTTVCRNQRGELVLDGEARVKLFDLR